MAKQILKPGRRIQWPLGGLLISCSREALLGSAASSHFARVERARALVSDFPVSGDLSGRRGCARRVAASGTVGFFVEVAPLLVHFYH